MSAQNLQEGIQTYSNLVEGSSLTPLAGSALQHTEGNTIGHIREPSCLGRVALKPDGVANYGT